MMELSLLSPKNRKDYDRRKLHAPAWHCVQKARWQVREQFVRIKEENINKNM